MEQRRSIRIPVNWELKLQQGNQVARANAIQFSEYGMLVVPPEAAQVGQRYKIHFSLPGGDKTFRLRGYAVYTGPRGVGVRFEFVPAEITAEFRRFMQQQPGQANAPTAARRP
jgi:hypothetical protein